MFSSMSLLRKEFSIFKSKSAGQWCDSLWAQFLKCWLNYFFLGIFHQYFKFACTYSCIGTSGKKIGQKQYFNLLLWGNPWNRGKVHRQIHLYIYLYFECLWTKPQSSKTTYVCNNLGLTHFIFRRETFNLTFWKKIQ